MADAAAAARKQTENYWHPNKHRSDRHAIYAGQYHASDQWGGTQDIMSIDPMFYEDDSSSSFGRDALQFYSIKIASIGGGLRWPIDVFGLVVARDVLDNGTRNVVFARARSDCQTVTEEHPYLELTGPSRAVVACTDLGNIEIVLKVKGASESEDRDLSFLALPFTSRGYCSYDRDDYTSKRSTLELAFGHVDRSVEATISVRLVGGSSWPEGFQGVLASGIASIDDAEVVLLDFEGNRLPVVADDGMIELSRHVVSVERRGGELKVSVVARLEKDEDIARRDDIVFTSKNAGRSCGVLDVIGSCKLQVTVAWTLF